MFGGLGNLLEGAIGAHPGGVSGLLNEALQDAGGLDGVVAKLNSAGLGEKVNSWLGKGPNTPLTEDEITSALGNQQLQQIATRLGIPLDAVAGTLAQHLPNAVDKASPDGTIVAAGAGVGRGVTTSPGA